MDNFLKDLGRSYIMSSFMPVAVFMVFIGLVFKDFIPLSVFKIINSFEQSWLILVTLSILFTTWGGWILYSSWSVIEGFFKGKYLPSFIKTKWTNYFQKQSKDKTKNYSKLRKILSDESKTAEDIYNDPRSKKEIENLNPPSRDEITNLRLFLPISEGRIGPTLLDNVANSANETTEEKYGLNPKVFWPLLYALLPTDYQKKLEDILMNYGILLNSAFLSLVFGVICLLTLLICPVINLITGQGLVYLPDPQTPANFLQRGFVNIRPIEILILGLASLLIQYGFYRLAVISGQQYYSYVSTAFDLYRFSILESLHIKLPMNINEEKGTWEKLNNMFVFQDKLSFQDKHSPIKTPLDLTYTHKATDA